MPCAVAEPKPLGQEAFVPPADFGEFFERYPKMVRWWLISEMHCPRELVEDHEQSLLAHLMGRSKSMAVAGVPDRIASYSQELRGGKTVKNPWGAFVGYVCDTLLLREYIKILRRTSRGGTRGDTVISIPTMEECSQDLAHLKLAQMLDMTPNQIDDYTKAVIQPPHDTGIVTKEFWEGFITFVDAREPQITPLLRALEDHDSMTHVKKAFEIGNKEMADIRARLLELMKMYRRVGCHRLPTRRRSN